LSIPKAVGDRLTLDLGIVQIEEVLMCLSEELGVLHDSRRHLRIGVVVDYHKLVDRGDEVVLEDGNAVRVLLQFLEALLHVLVQLSDQGGETIEVNSGKLLELKREDARVRDSGGSLGYR
jgi:hypothetical protein